MNTLVTADNDAGGNPARNLIGGDLVDLAGLRLRYRHSAGRQYLLEFKAELPDVTGR